MTVEDVFLKNVIQPLADASKDVSQTSPDLNATVNCFVFLNQNAFQILIMSKKYLDRESFKLFFWEH